MGSQTTSLTAASGVDSAPDPAVAGPSEVVLNVCGASKVCRWGLLEAAAKGLGSAGRALEALNGAWPEA